MLERENRPITLRPPERLPYMPGLDGLRAIAVMAVLLYHAAIPWIPGGFLGVDVFFVISGYLITSLLLLEWQRNGNVNLTAFWARRLRRLLPALITVLVVTSTFAMFFARDAVYRLAADATAAMAYITNWFLIFRGESYFEAFARPPLLRHLWSLAVEEQFYLVWPLVFTTVIVFIGTRRGFTSTTRAFLLIVGGGIAASAILMAVLYVPFGDPSRLYFGTDARAHVILVGVGLAFLWQPRRFRGTLGPRGRNILLAVGIAALVALGVIFTLSSEYGSFLYRGGFLVTASVTAVLIAVTVHPDVGLGSALSNRVLRWVGTRSYGIYLWHWPVYMVTRPGIDVPLNWASTFALRIAVTFALAEASYRLVERPIRQLGFVTWIRSLQGPIRRAVPQAAFLLPAFAAVFVIGLSVGLIRAGGGEPDGGDLAASGSADAVDARETTTTATAPSTSSPPTTLDAVAAQPTTTTMTVPETAAFRIIFIGDSVMLGATAELEKAFGEGTHVDATLSRQLKHAPRLVDRLVSLGLMSDVVVVHLGTNGPFNSASFDELMEALSGVDRVYFVNSHVPRRYEGTVNAALENGVERWDNAHLIDWNAFVEANGSVIGGDSTHLTGSGRSIYAEFLENAIGW